MDLKQREKLTAFMNQLRNYDEPEFENDFFSEDKLTPEGIKISIRILEHFLIRLQYEKLNTKTKEKDLIPGGFSKPVIDSIIQEKIRDANSEELLKIEEEIKEHLKTLKNLNNIFKFCSFKYKSLIKIKLQNFMDSNIPNNKTKRFHFQTMIDDEKHYIELV